MQRLRAALLASAILAVTAHGAFASSEPGGPDEPLVSDDAGTDGGDVTMDFSTTTNGDASASAGDMAQRPKAAKASLPGCSAAGPGQRTPVGTMLLAAGLVVVATASRRTGRRRG